MNDCSTSATEPRTCDTCKNVRYTWLDCLHVANDSSYYMRCTRPDLRACEHYVDDPDSLQRRYERLSQVAMQMRDWLFYYVETDPGHVVVESDQDEVREIREAFDALGVSVDD